MTNRAKSAAGHVLGVRLDRLALLALTTLAGFAGAKGWLHDHPQHNPWAPLNLNDPPGWATDRKLAALRSDPPACRATLARSDIAFAALPAVGARECRRADRVTLAPDALGVGFRPATPDATCAVDAGLAIWLRDGVQPAAARILGSRVATVEHFGTHACRRIYGRKEGSWSEHATGNAIDIAAFVLADGRRVRVLRGWDDDGSEARFLRAAHAAACGPFATVLGPDYNAAHADHFHLDQASGRIGWSVCR